MNRIDFPGWPELRRTTIEALREIPLPATPAAIEDAVTDRLNLSEEQRNLPNRNGHQSELYVRLALARSHLKGVGVIDNPRRAQWTITDYGVSADLTEIEDSVTRRLSQVSQEYYRRDPPAQSEPASDERGEEPVDLPDTDDLEGQSWKDALLRRLNEMPFDAFERLARSLLLSAGFDDVAVTQRTHDRGLDGVGTYRPAGLISFRTSFQCKRWKDDQSVGAPAVQAFQGASQGHSDRGIIITTTYFTRAAITEASRPGAFRVDLIDGDRLCDLLKQYRLGVDVRERTVEDITIDNSYFDRFEGG